MSIRKKKHFLIVAILFIVPLIVHAQYKSDVPSIPGLNTNRSAAPSSIFGIDLSKVEFHNSYSMEVSSFGGDAVALGLLKSSFDYMINPQVSVRGYVGLMHSPFSSMNPAGGQSSFADGINKDNILYGGEITYQPKENIFFHIGINRIAFGKD